MDITRGQFVIELLTRCDYPQSIDNITGALTWVRAEWGGDTPRAKYNPLSTVQPMPGSTPFNTTGVQNFATFDDGLTANALVLLTGDYAPIRQQLAAGNDNSALIAAISSSRWGSKPTQNFLDYTTQHLLAESALVVGPPSGVVVPTQEQFMILCPNKPTLNGRQPMAVLDIVNKRVLLFNGASLSATGFPDHAVGDYRVWPVPSTQPLLGMDRTRNPTTHEYDQRGVVIAAVDGGSFQALWS